ncbi:hypothetical protein [Brevibacillus choshinensis]|uniref:hypothetical protein n=1 Tax=Brevibacillus choshinensis TaxID=54911 RepID=UPI002E1B9651|nr:hypothetical protein [Brevibacillus choshinensis]
MIFQSYLQTIRNDLLARVTGGSLLLNDTISVPVEAVTIADHPITGVQNAVALQVTAPHIASVPVITNAKLLTFTGEAVAEKSMQVETNGAQFMSFSFVFEVRGGA